MDQLPGKKITSFPELQCSTPVRHFFYFVLTSPEKLTPLNLESTLTPCTCAAVESLSVLDMSEYEVPQMPDGRERVKGLELEVRPENKEMDILKDLPSFNSENFSKFGSNGCSGKNGSVSVYSGIIQ